MPRRKSDRSPLRASTGTPGPADGVRPDPMRSHATVDRAWAPSAEDQAWLNDLLRGAA